ncbi:uncharacterized protein LOC134817308 [Bolinopsis microptera]|uniref:uncharacterized protein LOC134817308 n=1 Tax=Bolinopsis microptera TaxID=2820187 RepID=UPI003079EFDE
MTMFQINALVLVTLASFTSAQMCTFPKLDVGVCDKGFLAYSPQRFTTEERFNPGQFMLEASSEAGGEGKWFYESRERLGKIVSVKRKFKRAGEESYEETGDEEIPHSYTLKISKNKLIPGKYIYKTDVGKSCAFFVY